MSLSSSSNKQTPVVITDLEKSPKELKKIITNRSDYWTLMDYIATGEMFVEQQKESSKEIPKYQLDPQWEKIVYSNLHLLVDMKKKESFVIKLIKFFVACNIFDDLVLYAMRELKGERQSEKILLCYVEQFRRKRNKFRTFLPFFIDCIKYAHRIVANDLYKKTHSALVLGTLHRVAQEDDFSESRLTAFDFKNILDATHFRKESIMNVLCYYMPLTQTKLYLLESDVLVLPNEKKRTENLKCVSDLHTKSHPLYLGKPSPFYDYETDHNKKQCACYCSCENCWHTVCYWACLIEKTRSPNVDAKTDTKNDINLEAFDDVKSIMAHLRKNPLDLVKFIIPKKHILTDPVSMQFVVIIDEWKEILKKNFYLLETKQTYHLMSTFIKLFTNFEADIIVGELIPYAIKELNEDKSIDLLTVYAKAFRCVIADFPKAIEFFTKLSVYANEIKNEELYNVNYESLSTSLSKYILATENPDTEVVDEVMVPLTIDEITEIINSTKTRNGSLMNMLCYTLFVQKKLELIKSGLLILPNKKMQKGESYTCNNKVLVDTNYGACRDYHSNKQCECYCECDNCYHTVCFYCHCQSVECVDVCKQ